MPLDNPVALPRFDWRWLPNDMHQLFVDPNADIRPLSTDFRARPARVPMLNGRTLSFRRKPQRVAHGDCVSFGAAVTAEFFTTEHHDEAL